MRQGNTNDQATWTVHPPEGAVNPPLVRCSRRLFPLDSSVGKETRPDRGSCARHIQTHTGRKRTMSNQSENEKQQPQASEEVRQFLLAELDASKQAIEELSNEQLEAIAGG